MSIRYEGLDATIRNFMVCELERDQANGSLYISPRLTDAGAGAWPQILREACAQRDDTWIASTLRSRDFMRTTEQQSKPKGGLVVSHLMWKNEGRGFRDPRGSRQ